MSGTIQQRLGVAMRRRRLELGLTQEAVGLEAGTDAGSISRLEAGLRSPRVETVAAVAAALQLSLAELFERMEA